MERYKFFLLNTHFSTNVTSFCSNSNYWNYNEQTAFFFDVIVLRNYNVL